MIIKITAKELAQRLSLDGLLSLKAITTTRANDMFFLSYPGKAREHAALLNLILVLSREIHIRNENPV
jgi:hypothetical protein